MKREAENLVREVLHAYNKRVEKNDLSECYAIAVRHLTRLSVKQPKREPTYLPPGLYRVGDE